MRGLRRSNEFLIDEKMGEDLLPVRSRVGMIIRARVSRVALFLRVSIISGEVVIARFRRNRCLELEFGIIRP